MIRKKLTEFTRESNWVNFDFTKPGRVHGEVEGEVTNAELECADGITRFLFSVSDQKFEISEGYNGHMIPVLRCGDYVIIHVDLNHRVEGIQVLDSTGTNVILAVRFNDSGYKTNKTLWRLNAFID